MKLLFVQPHTTSVIKSMWGKISRKIYFYPNLQLQQLAATTPKKHKIIPIDERHKEINFNQPCDLVNILFNTPDAKRSYEIADEFRKRGKKVALGGWHPSTLPDEAKQHADSVLVGEMELTWPELLNDFEDGSLKPFYVQKEPINPEIIPPAYRDIGDNVFPIARIQATRGCPYKCEYCRIPRMEGNRLRKRPIENVIKEIKTIRQKFLFFSDASLTLDPEYSKTLFQEMKGLRKKFTCSANTDVLARDDEFLKLAKSAGCTGLHVGFESISKEIIDHIDKRTNNVEEYPLIIKRIHENKMAVFASIIFGFDIENLDSLKETYKTVCKWDVELFETNTLTPFPGTPLFDRLEKEGRILTRNWEKYNEGDTVFKLKNMPMDEYAKLSWKITCDYNFSGIKRIERIKRLYTLGFYPFVVTVFQGHFW